MNPIIPTTGQRIPVVFVGNGQGSKVYVGALDAQGSSGSEAPTTGMYVALIDSVINQASVSGTKWTMGSNTAKVYPFTPGMDTVDTSQPPDFTFTVYNTNQNPSAYGVPMDIVQDKFGTWWLVSVEVDEFNQAFDGSASGYTFTSPSLGTWLGGDFAHLVVSLGDGFQTGLTFLCRGRYNCQWPSNDGGSNQIVYARLVDIADGSVIPGSTQIAGMYNSTADRQMGQPFTLLQRIPVGSQQLAIAVLVNGSVTPASIKVGVTDTTGSSSNPTNQLASGSLLQLT